MCKTVLVIIRTKCNTRTDLDLMRNNDWLVSMCKWYHIHLRGHNRRTVSECLASGQNILQYNILQYSTVSNLRSIVTVILLVSIDVFVSTECMNQKFVVFVETAFGKQWKWILCIRLTCCSMHIWLRPCSLFTLISKLPLCSCGSVVRALR